MYTRCKGCHTVHPINARLLSQAAGQYRCAKCKKQNNALEALFDQWPEAGERSESSGQVPELGGQLALASGPERAGEVNGEVTGEDAGENAFPLVKPADRGPWLRVGWIVAGLVITISAGLAIAQYFGQELVAPERIQTTLEQVGLREAEPPKPFRDPGQIELVSREMSGHPLRPRVLVLQATIVNRAAQTQPYPEVQVRLFDMSNQVVAERRYRPTDYLSSTQTIRSGMAPDAFLQFSLEMLDPGDSAVGFELEFH